MSGKLWLWIFERNMGKLIVKTSILSDPTAFSARCGERSLFQQMRSGIGWWKHEFESRNNCSLVPPITMRVRVRYSVIPRLPPQKNVVQWRPPGPVTGLRAVHRPKGPVRCLSFKGNRLLPIQSQPNQSFLIISLIKYYKYWLLGAYKYCLAFGHCNLSILTLPRQWSTYWILNQSITISAVLFPDHQDVFQSQSVERHLLILTRNGKKPL